MVCCYCFLLLLLLGRGCKLYCRNHCRGQPRIKWTRNKGKTPVHIQPRHSFREKLLNQVQSRRKLGIGARLGSECVLQREVLRRGRETTDFGRGGGGVVDFHLFQGSAAVYSLEAPANDRQDAKVFGLVQRPKPSLTPCPHTGTR